jgi:phenylalanyl-tRNA synthetase beta chain
MRVPFEWLKDFVDISAAPEDVAARLTMAGLEVEGLEVLDGDVVFEVNVTPNRPDCLSILGIAREVAAAFALPLKTPDTHIGGALPSSAFTVDILDPDLCKRYTGRVIKGVKVAESPAWLKGRLERCGIRSLNNIVDITNYVLLELGHPLHAFDAEKLSGQKIRVARAGGRGMVKTLDGVERKVSSDALLIWDGSEPVAVAGIMGGEESGVTPDTADIFLESAYFEPTSIRRTSKELGLRSESSYRFERGTDIEFLVNALDRAALLMRETAGGTICDVVDTYPEKYVAPKVEVEYRRVNALIGTRLANEEMRSLLARVGLAAEDAGEVFYVYPPPYRRDIREYFDVVEEIARLYNFTRIPVTIPRTILSDGVLNKRENDLARIRESMRKAGFTEVVNYSFMNPSDLDMLSIPAYDTRRRCIRIMNPLRQEESLMRTTLMPALLSNFIYNLSRGARDIRIFETARTFIDGGGKLPVEELRLAGLLYKDESPSLWREEASPFFLVKGALQALFEELKTEGVSYAPSEEVFLHPGKSADVLVKEAKIGFIGEVGPAVVERLDVKARKPEIIVCELDLEALLASIPVKVTYAEIPKYPFIDRDIAIILDEDITSDRVMQELLGYKSEFIEKVELFDYYKGKNIPGGRKSLAFRIVYRAKDRTLTDSEVESIHEGLVGYILKKTGGELRA